MQLLTKYIKKVLLDSTYRDYIIIVFFAIYYATAIFIRIYKWIIGVPVYVWWIAVDIAIPIIFVR